jgi:hypothetical protein
MRKAARMSKPTWIAFLAGAVVVLLGLAAMALAAEAGWVAGINGAPSFTRDGKTAPLRRGEAVQIGDRIRTDDISKVKILLGDDSVLNIGPRTEVTIDELTLSSGGRKGRLAVLFGRFRLSVEPWLTGASDFEVQTPSATAGVRGTVLWGDTELDAICALEGTVEVRPRTGDASARLETGHCVTHMARGETSPFAPGQDQLAKYLKEVTLD